MRTPAILLAMFFLSTPAFSHGTAETLEERKEEKVKHLDEELEAINTAKTCISAASDVAAFKKCEADLRKAKKKCGKKCDCNHQGNKK